MISDFLKNKGLTDREIELSIYLIRTGKQFKEIGREMEISQHVASNKAQSIYEKTGYKSRHELQAEYIKYMGG